MSLTMKNKKKQIVKWILLILLCFLMVGVYIRYNIPNYSHEVFGVTYMTMNKSNKNLKNMYGIQEVN